LQTDAGFAYDEAVRSFNLEGVNKGNKKSIYKVNFGSADQYKQARLQEIKDLHEAGISVQIDDVPAVFIKIRKKIDGITAKDEDTNKSSAYKGVYALASSNFRSQIVANKKVYALGYYILETDAARSYDEAVEALMTAHAGKKAKPKNFETFSDYQMARSQELETSGKKVEDSGSLEDVADQIKHQINNFKRKITQEATRSEDDKTEKEVAPSTEPEVTGELEEGKLVFGT
jgi:hypothetical protein